jgi:gas vesicle protein
MMKLLGGVIIGVFVGAALFEFLNRKSPHLLRTIEDKAKETVRSAVDAFEQGYSKQKAARGETPAG